jgi:ATP-dependent Lon protease
MERVLLPADNRDDWEELDKEIRSAIAVDFVETADEAFALLFDKGIQKTNSPKKVPAKRAQTSKTKKSR